MQDTLCGIARNQRAPMLEHLDSHICCCQSRGVGIKNPEQPLPGVAFHAVAPLHGRRPE